MEVHPIALDPRIFANSFEMVVPKIENETPYANFSKLKKRYLTGQQAL